MEVTAVHYSTRKSAEAIADKRVELLRTVLKKISRKQALKDEKKAT